MLNHHEITMLKYWKGIPQSIKQLLVMNLSVELGPKCPPSSHKFAMKDEGIWCLLIFTLFTITAAFHQDSNLPVISQDPSLRHWGQLKETLNFKIYSWKEVWEWKRPLVAHILNVEWRMIERFYKPILTYHTIIFPKCWDYLKKILIIFSKFKLLNRVLKH